MTQVISTERLFSLSSFEGLRLIRSYSVKQPELSISELIALIEKLDPDGLSLDLTAAAYLGELVGQDCRMEGSQYYQTCIKVILIEHQPIWAKAMRSGRKRFVETLDLNDQDVFAAAGLMSDPPSNDVVTWWDDVVGHSRLITDKEKMEQARKAEILSIEHERERLKKLGIEKEPEWPGLDNNYAGYDVLSYDLGQYGLINRMIEVKSTTASPLRFFVTQNEWNQAKKVGDAYLFHVWDMTKSPPILFIKTVQEIAPHIPTNNEKGAWTNATIPLSI
tara:strand:+ start:30478 stop:31308 length:831 start_codon:yes stop_codon:yes gene_type:complete